MSRFALGMAALGRPGYMTVGHAQDLPEGRTREAMRAHAHRVLDRAFERGLRWVDAARSYGDAERFVRSWLDARGLAPGAVTVSSKWGYEYVADWRADAPVHETKDHSLAMLRRQLEESRELLGPHLALYQIHSATPESGVLENAEVLDELARLRDGGLPVGVSVSGPDQPRSIRQALAIQRGGARLFASVQATWNLLERSCEAALGEAHAAGLTVLVKEPLANGKLTSRFELGSAGPLADVASSKGVSPDAIALAAARAQPWADVVLLGAGTVEQLDSNLRAQELVLGEHDWRALESMRTGPERYWQERSRLPWG